MPELDERPQVESSPLKLSAIKDRHILRFERRSKRYSALGAAVVLTIFGLLGMTAYVFFFAQEITRNISTFDLLRQLDVAQQAQSEIVEIFNLALEGVKEEQRVGQRTTQEVVNATDRAYRAQTQLKLIVEKSRLIREDGYPSNLDTERAREEFEAIIAGLEDHKVALEEEYKAASERFDVGENTRTDVAQAQGAVAIISREIEVTKIRRDAANTAAEIRQASGDIDVLNLVNTNLVRFGGVTITLFLISILVPIYRYNARLASFY